jgi:hypothetical protein
MLKKRHNLRYVGFEVLTVVVMKGTIFWDKTEYMALYPSR